MAVPALNMRQHQSWVFGATGSAEVFISCRMWSLAQHCTTLASRYLTWGPLGVCTKLFECACPIPYTEVLSSVMSKPYQFHAPPSKYALLLSCPATQQPQRGDCRHWVPLASAQAIQTGSLPHPVPQQPATCAVGGAVHSSTPCMKVPSIVTAGTVHDHWHSMGISHDVVPGLRCSESTKAGLAGRATGEPVMVKLIPRGKQLDRHLVEQLKEAVGLCHPVLLQIRHLYLTEHHLVAVINPAACTLHSLALYGLSAAGLHAAPARSGYLMKCKLQNLHAGEQLHFTLGRMLAISLGNLAWLARPEFVQRAVIWSGRCHMFNDTIKLDLRLTGGLHACLAHICIECVDGAGAKGASPSRLPGAIFSSSSLRLTTASRWECITGDLLQQHGACCSMPVARCLDSL